jgi:hypothetical protein
MKSIVIHLTGGAAAVTEVRQFCLFLPDSATYQDVISGIAAAQPALVGMVIDHDGKSMLSSNLFVVNSQEVILQGMWDLQPGDGDILTLLSPATGGSQP